MQANGSLPRDYYRCGHSDDILMAGRTVCTVIVLAGSSSNLLMFGALVRARAHLHSANMFIIALCACNAAFCMFCMPFILSEFIFNRWVFGDTFCRLLPFFTHLILGFTIWLFVAIAMNRFVLCAMPTAYARVYTTRNILLIFLLCLALVLAVLVPPLVGMWGTFGFENKRGYCSYFGSQSHAIVMSVFGLWLPIVCICSLYSQILMFVFAHRMKMKRMRAGGSRLTSSEVKLILTTFSVFLSFLLCFTPFLLVGAIATVTDDEEGTTLLTSKRLHIICRLVACCSPLLHSPIYVLTNEQYRTAIWQCWRCVNVEPIVDRSTRHGLVCTKKLSPARALLTNNNNLLAKPVRRRYSSAPGPTRPLVESCASSPALLVSRSDDDQPAENSNNTLRMVYARSLQQQ